MHEPIEQREELWDRFLQRWPLEQLPNMTLPAYNQAGSDDSFCRWLEKHLESLGSIWGGSSLKFGIYSRANTEKDPSGQNGVTANGRYAWYSRYGQSEEVAFARVRDLIVATAQAAREGRLEAIEAIDLWPILKWKIAFLYQNRQQPTVLPIYLRKYLAAALTGPVPTLHAELYRVLLAERGNQPLLAYADAVYERGQVALQHQQRVAVLGHFAGAADLAARLQAANQQMPIAVSGEWRGMSLLFPMEKLFEQYVEGWLREQLAPAARLTSQASRAYLCEHGQGRMFCLKPDLLIDTAEQRWILDTKWKRVDARKPETNYDLSQADFYQLFAYGHKYRINTGTPKLVLIYPSWSGLKQALPAFDYGQGMSLWALPFDLDGDRLLDADFAGIPLVGKRTDQVTVQVSDQAYAAAIAR